METCPALVFTDQRRQKRNQYCLVLKEGSVEKMQQCVSLRNRPTVSGRCKDW